MTYRSAATKYLSRRKRSRTSARQPGLGEDAAVVIDDNVPTSEDEGGDKERTCHNLIEIGESYDSRAAKKSYS